jgi:NADH-quinone oxidoreductase subunit N
LPLLHFLPEFYLIFCFLLFFCYGMYFSNYGFLCFKNVLRRIILINYLSTMLILIIVNYIILLYFKFEYFYSSYNFQLVDTPSTFFFKLFLSLTFLSLLLINNYVFSKDKRIIYWEFLIFYFLCFFSSLLLISANDFLIMYLLIEFQSICLYVLVCFNKNSLLLFRSRT